MGLFDILAIPSDTEQFPICQVEAMAAGVAICGTDVGDVKNILPPLNKSYIVPVADETGFTDKLRALIADSGLRAALAQCNRTHVASQYSLEQTSQAFLSLFCNAISSARAPVPNSK
jgi:glycosyltransferase involved in cell wall biosynthesis